MTETEVPHNGWLPRHHQVRLWCYLEDGGKRAMAVWHRRAGKDEVCLHWAATQCVIRPANFVHCLPEYEQGRKAIWNAVNPHSGRRRIDEAFPHSMRESTNDQGMTIRMHTGATWSVIGSDRYDTSLVGTSVAGIVFSEFALANPSAWAYARPTVEENDGWAIFITTPRGRNHAHEMFKHAQHAPGWFCELLTAEDTGALTREQLDEALREYRIALRTRSGHSAVSPGVSMRLAGVGARLVLCDGDGRRARARDACSRWSCRPERQCIARGTSALGTQQHLDVQRGRPQIYVYDHYVGSGVGFEHYADVLEKPVSRARLDARDGLRAARRDGEGNGHRAHARRDDAGARACSPKLAPNASLEDGRNAVRRTLPLCVFHPRTDEGDLPGTRWT